MNCQDVSRLIDSGKFSALTVDQRRDADAHVLSCRRCAPLWIMHARIVVMPVPAMPAELSARCLTLVAAGSRAVPHRASRRMMFVIGGVVALAAAASMLGVYFSGSSAPQTQQVAVPASAEVSAEAQPPASPAEAVPAQASAAPAEQSPEPSYSLPLLPAPVSLDAERQRQIQLAQRKAMELYPQIVDGPEIKGHFVIAVTLHSNGTVLTNSMVIANSLDEVYKEMHKVKPVNGQVTFTGGQKGTVLEDGRVLRGDLTLGFTMVPDSYDLSKAETRVQEIVRAQRDRLLLPPGKGGVNTLTVLLSEDGSIEREIVEFIGMSELMKSAEEEPADAGSLAADLARKLGVDVDRIGVVGSTRVTSSASDAVGANTRVLNVNYAWSRRKDETAPVYSGESSIWSPGIDTAAALVVVERLIPEVFLSRDSSATGSDGPSTRTPTVLLTVEGKVIATGITNMQLDIQSQMQRLAPGVVAGSTASPTVRNRAGQSAAVLFVWEATPEQREAQEKRRLATPPPGGGMGDMGM